MIKNVGSRKTQSAQIPTYQDYVCMCVCLCVSDMYIYVYILDTICLCSHHHNSFMTTGVLGHTLVRLPITIYGYA